MVGLKKIEAGDDLPAKVRKPKAKAKVKEEYEEWNGIEADD